MMNNLRRTGRTTRMLDYAREVAKTGTKVAIVFETEREAVLRTAENIELYDLGVRFFGRDCTSINWNHFKLNGVDAGLVLFDHFALQSKYEHVLKMIHQFDFLEGTLDRDSHGSVFKPETETPPCCTSQFENLDGKRFELQVPAPYRDAASDATQVPTTGIVRARRFLDSM